MSVYLSGGADVVMSAVQLAAERQSAATFLIFPLILLCLFSSVPIINLSLRPVAILRS